MYQIRNRIQTRIARVKGCKPTTTAARPASRYFSYNLKLYNVMAGGSPGLVVKGEARNQKVVSLNPGAGY